MRLTFKPFDGRRVSHRDIIDEDTGKVVGHIRAGGVGTYCFGGIDVDLFDGKYSIRVNRYDQCWGFVKGVEAVKIGNCQAERASRKSFLPQHKPALRGSAQSADSPSAQARPTGQRPICSGANSRWELPASP